MIIFFQPTTTTSEQNFLKLNLITERFLLIGINGTLQFVLLDPDVKKISVVQIVCVYFGWNARFEYKLTNEKTKKKFLRSSELMCNIGGVTLRHKHNVSIIIKQYSLRNKRMNECFCLTPKPLQPKHIESTSRKLAFVILSMSI